VSPTRSAAPSLHSSRSMTASFYVGAYWKERPQTLREYVAESKRFLVRLRDVHPVFLRWMSWGRTPDSEGVELGRSGESAEHEPAHAQVDKRFRGLLLPLVVLG
jgi:hypothetical protein